MSYLILSTPSIDYANAISHELWLLVRPASVGASETTQFYTYAVGEEGVRLALYLRDESLPIHRDADEVRFAEKISGVVTPEERELIEASIEDAKGGSLSILEMVESIDSLSPNLRTREQLEAEGWFEPTEEI